MAPDKRWRRQGHARGRYAPRLWPVWPVALSAVVVSSALAGGIYLELLTLAASRPGLNGRPASIDLLDVIKTTITVAGFVGAVLVGVYSYRKQRLAEGDAHRADAEQLAQRYTTAASQLGHEKAAVRLAGVYAMARLADDWDEQRQVCIDVLCAYLRMPYETDITSEKHREGEREVRHTIIRLIRDHLQDPSSPTTWCGCDLDFTNATFDGGNFLGAKFTGGDVFFVGAEFIDGGVSFDSATFSGGRVSFDDAEFSADTVSFNGAEFSGGDFYGANFSGSRVSFDGAKFSDGEVSFYWARFSGGTVSFDGAEFSGGEVSFQPEEFGGGMVSFDRAEFSGGAVFFLPEYLNGGTVSFDGAKFTTNCDIIWGPFEPPVAWTEIQERELQQNEQGGTMD
jgi:uncharacterized protein YjbI with pentapeptide repeats